MVHQTYRQVVITILADKLEWEYRQGDQLCVKSWAGLCRNVRYAGYIGWRLRQFDRNREILCIGRWLNIHFRFQKLKELSVYP